MSAMGQCEKRPHDAAMSEMALTPDRQRAEKTFRVHEHFPRCRAGGYLPTEPGSDFSGIIRTALFRRAMADQIR
jgi:hypothetical protein